MATSTENLKATTLFNVKDVVAVVSGGGSGIGRMITQALAANGARKIYILGRRLEVLQECASTFPDIIVPLECDVVSKDSLQKCADVVATEVGFVNLVVCNAGTGGPETTKLNAESTLDEFIESQWQHSVSSFTDTFKINTAGYWYTTLAFLKLLHLGNEKGNIQQKSQVIATCSTLGLSRLAPTGRFAYGQSKAASTHLMKQLSTSLVPYHIRANMIAPGLFPTDMTSVMMSSAGAYNANKVIPEGRAGDSEDMAGVILFLASRAGAYLNGNVLPTNAADYFLLAILVPHILTYCKMVQERLEMAAKERGSDALQLRDDSQPQTSDEGVNDGPQHHAIEAAMKEQPENGSTSRFFSWLQVLNSFCLYFNTYGIISSFGIYQTYYEAELGYDASRASMIGSLQSFLIFFTTALAGPLYDAGYHRHILVIGASGVVFGTFMQSISKEYWHFILAQSICVGTGGGLISFLGPTVLATYFKKHLALASGIGSSGSGIAGIVFPIMYRQLLPRVGFGWTVRIMGFVSLATLAVPVLTMRPRVLPTKLRKRLDTTAFRDVPFVIFLVGNFLVLLGAFTPFFYVQVFAIDKSIAGAELSFYVLASMNLASTLGRIVPNFVTTPVGPFNMLILSALISVVAGLAYIAVTNVAGLIVTSAFYGFASGGFFALQPVVLIWLCPDPQLIGTRLGMAFCFLSFALLASNPVAGAIKDVGGFRGYSWLQIETNRIRSCIILYSYQDTADSHHLAGYHLFNFAMSTSIIDVEYRGRVAVITIDNPKKLNALSQLQYYELANRMREVAARDEVFITVLIGKGRGFDIRSNPEKPADPEKLRLYWMQQFLAFNITTTEAFASHPKILVVALNGPVFGLSASLASHGDFIYCTPHAFLLTPFASLGLVSEGGGSLTLVQRLGISKAKEALLMGKKIPADELHSVGFVNRVFDCAEGDDAGFRGLVLREVDEWLGEHLVGQSLISIKKLIRQPDTDVMARQNVAEVFAGMESLIKGVPQAEFDKIAAGEKRYKL
ncbi:hypothetical protein AK830_g7195 [Neonectria ditissima]|uniref:Major facilitator superfamily (MFS) profile domain-containing protein n=1 Tax=Neonectria ditissima TaxID=78410 RepID=A0A0P7BEK4_9HYPO|nr:hypothetical protein AK830_g7195 [Neonectria ditissima]